MMQKRKPDPNLGICLVGLVIGLFWGIPIGAILMARFATKVISG